MYKLREEFFFEKEMIQEEGESPIYKRLYGAVTQGILTNV